MSVVNVRVAAIQQVTPQVKHFTLEREDGGELPPFSGGSHVVVVMNSGAQVYRNAYSLMGNPGDTRAYHIAVRRQEQSRGGSSFMHDQVKAGTLLQITLPTNLFPISRMARKHLLIAGGIGITPFMSQLHDIQRNGHAYELHYAFRSPEHGAFTSELKARCGEHAHFHVDSQGSLMDIPALLAEQPLGTHVYVCGPEPMVKAVLETAAELGWPGRHVHSEQFGGAHGGEPFSVTIASSGMVIEVDSQTSMLEAIENAGVDIDSLCRGGACGQCMVEVISCDGQLHHHDTYLSETEKAAGKLILPCVSRANCTQLVVDL